MRVVYSEAKVVVNKQKGSQWAEWGNKREERMVRNKNKEWQDI
jgi:hypothetical protein